MDFLTKLENNSILLIPNNIKNKILDYINENKLLINIKLLTFRELQQGLLYSFSNEAIYEVMKTNKLSFETAKDFINNTYYLTEDNYEGKLKIIYDINIDLEKKELLIKDPLFINLLKSKSKMYTYGFTSINKLQNYLLDLASNYIEVIGIPNEEKKYKHTAYQLPTLEDEVIYVAEEIAKKIDEGIPIDKIYIANYSSEYYFSIKKIFGLYNIPIYLKGDTKLYDTPIGKYFINHLSDNMDKLLFTIRKKFDTDNNQYNSKVYNKISNLVNSYYWTSSYVEIKDVIEAEMKTITIQNDHFSKEIVTTSITDNIFNDDEYVFLIGFNQGSIPKTYKDEDFLDDSIKPSLMENTLEQNNASRIRNTIAIKNIKNLTITLKEISTKSKYLPSTLIDGNNIILEKKEISYSNYSDEFNKLLYATRLDDLIKFNEEHEDIKELHKTYDINYKTYSNKYDGHINENMKNRLIERGYSYSSISSYFECPFKYYLNIFYKLNKYTTTFSTFIGNAFHEVLDKCLKDDTINIDDIYYGYIEENKKNLPYGIKEQYYVESVKDELYYIVNAIKKQYEYSTHNDEWHEKEIVLETDKLDLNVKASTKIQGKVDKVLLSGNDVIIIDYKTGNSTKIKRKYFEYGITIQLPIYLYLLKNINKDYNIAGMYLQHILRGLVYRTNKKSLEQNKFDRLKLDGLTLDDMSKVSKFDKSFNNSDIIQALQITKDGKYRWDNNIITYEQEDELYNTMKRLLEECINNSIDGIYNINPIKNKEIDGCEYCSYRDICFKREDDIRNIKIKIDEDDVEEGDEDE